MDRTLVDLALRENEQLTCPDCGRPNVETEWKDRPFPYGIGAEQVELVVELPFRRCRDCGLQYLDEVGEDLTHERVCRHLGVMTPAEIVALREGYGLSRKEFCELTKLGEATLARWERGALIQNAANDQFLRLLAHPDNVARLRAAGKGDALAPQPS